MKNLLNLFILVCLSSGLFSQSFIEKNFAKELNDDKVTRVTVGTKAFTLLTSFTANLKDEDAKKVGAIAAKVRSLDLIAQEKIGNAATLYSEAIAKTRGFEELIKVKAKGANVSLRIKEKNNIITQIIGIIAADSTFVVFDLEGDLDMNEVGELTSRMSESNINRVFQGKNLDMTDIKVYPNPVNTGGKVTIDVPTAMEKGKFSVVSMDGKKVKDISIEGPNFELETDNLPIGTYNLLFEKEGVTVSRKLVIAQ
jgi:hypothetical protein